ncbi:hypothetical protein [Deinococcus sonorensis]|uniref:Uncharacterized protein n=2 Tax=Deinococcus sonorensis TaxID=309891 RepID=A0AAU7U628_9DEIO
MTEDLQGAVAALHRAFSDVPRPVHVTGCTNCCISEAELQRLVDVPREQLMADELQSYAYNVPDTVGEEADFRYFLPRLLDLVAQGELQGLGAGWVIRRLKYAPWTTWSSAQVQAIRGYLMVWWLDALSDPAGGPDEHLEHLGEIEPPEAFERYLDRWLTAGPVAIDHLATFVHQHIAELALGRGWDAFATRVATDTLYRWLRSGPPAQTLVQNDEARPDAPGALLRLEAALLVTP